MSNQVYIKCFNCANRNSNGFCSLTTCIYTPIQTQNINESQISEDKDYNIKIYDREECVASVLILTNKLNELKDIKEQLGCPLEVVFKALNEGVSIKVEHLPDVIERPRLYYSDDFKCYCLELLFGEYVIKLSDYQKTWWLKEEKS